MKKINMHWKLELKKLLISFLFVTFQVFYDNTSKFQNSIVDGLNVTIFGWFDNIEVFLIGFIGYVLGYLFFNLVYLIVYIISKFLRLKRDILLITSFIIFIVIFINVLNDQLIFSDLHDYSGQSYFAPVTSDSIGIDSTNYKDFSWFHKEVSSSTPSYVITEEIVFNSDSTFTLIGTRIKYGKMYLFRKLFNSKSEYNLTKPYVYGNFMTTHSLFDSTSFNSIQIRFNKLFLNTAFY